MPQPQTPADVVRAVTAGVSRLVAGDLDSLHRERQLDELAGYYAERTNVRHPFAPLGDTPLHTRGELRDHFAAAPNRPDIRFELGPMTAHRTADPEVVIVEFSYRGSVADRPFELPCIFVARVRDGMIVESRDYGDHVGFARVFGGLSELTTALAAAPANPA